MVRIKSYSESFALSAQGIDDFSLWLENTLRGADTERRSCLRVRLLSEELLLRMLENLDAQTAFTAFVDLRFQSVSLRIEMEGEAFNPLSETAQELGEWNSSLLTAIGLRPKYSYSGGKNILRFNWKQKRMNPVLKMLMLLFIGAAAGLLGLWLMPQTMRETSSAAALTPAFDIWTRVLNAASGPIIFFMALTTILNASAITRQGGSSVRVIGRYLLLTLLMLAAARAISVPFFSTAQLTKTAQSISWKQALSNLVPGNVVEPFLDSDTAQLLLLAFPLGAALIAAGDHAGMLRKGVQETNVVGSLIASGLSRAVPYCAGLFLCLEIWNRRVQILIGIWKPLALAFAISVLLLFSVMLLFSVRMKVKIPALIQKLKKPMLTALRSAPLDEIMESASGSCVRQLGIDARYTGVCLPQGMVLFMPISAIGTLLFSIYLLHAYQLQLSLGWQIITVFLIEILFVATPPVPGANLLAFSALFSWIGIPREAILDAMIFDILFGFFASAANLVLLQLETAQQAERLGLLNKDRLIRHSS